MEGFLALLQKLLQQVRDPRESCLTRPTGTAQSAVTGFKGKILAGRTIWFIFHELGPLGASQVAIRDTTRMGQPGIEIDIPKRGS